MGPVVVLGSRNKERVLAAVDEVLPFLQREFGVVATDLDGTLDLETTEAKWALVFGGDGALLNVSRRMGSRPLPTLAVNFGKLGFLTEVEFKQLNEALVRVKEGRTHLRNRMRLMAEMGPDWRHYALNDVVITGVQSGRVFHVSAKIGGHEALRYAGDGVVIATPTGSTAYSMAAGGPIVDPELHATVITPLCPHALSHRPLVVPGKQTIELYLRDEDPAGRVVVDGQVSGDLQREHTLRVHEADEPFPLIRIGVRSHYSRLRKMLGWGGRPKYQQK
ncbi:MAG: NAD(+)/NADH kinase [Planctomycetota bacterium]